MLLILPLQLIAKFKCFSGGIKNCASRRKSKKLYMESVHDIRSQKHSDPPAGPSY